MVMDAQAQTNRVGDLVERENRAMTLWMVDLEKCLVGASGVRLQCGQGEADRVLGCRCVIGQRTDEIEYRASGTDNNVQCIE